MMWALVKEKAEKGLWLKRVPVPVTGKNDVKIKIHKITPFMNCGIPTAFL
jgi:threonine 3-dehydrogenase